MNSGWEKMTGALASAIEQVRETAPDPDTADEGEAYVARVLTGCLNDVVLGHLLTEDGFSRALPTRGGPNPDYIMRHAPVDVSRRYRIEGKLNDSERVGIGLYRFGPGGSVDIADYIAIGPELVDEDGSFSVAVAADAKDPGALRLESDTPVLLVRILHRNTKGETARLRLVGAPPIPDLALVGGNLENALDRAAQVTVNSVQQFLEWSALASATPNAFSPDTESLSQGMQGDPDTRYFLGYFDLAEGECLQVVMPAGLACYWSIHAYNHWCEYLPGASAHDRNTYADKDGTITVTIGPATPITTINRVDTIGRHKGVLVCRIIGSDLDVPPNTRIV